MGESKLFEIGSEYEFRVINGGNEIKFFGIVETYEHPVVKLKDYEPLVIHFDESSPIEIPSRPGQILNLTSANFISAVKKVTSPACVSSNTAFQSEVNSGIRRS